MGKGEGCEHEGHGFETTRQQIFFSFFFFLGGTKMPFVVRQILKGLQII